ncbi:HNH endonuclease, partial [Bacteroides sp. OttesenSCG-928-N06]|nr:HNH endonuclease [Bacteroides sp. OttesenSCG-928-N06]
SPAKILKAAFNVGKRAYKTYKASGKLDIGKALIQEGVNIVDNVGTLFDSDASTFDKVIAGVDLVTGFGSEISKGIKALGIASDANDAAKKTKREASAKSRAKWEESTGEKLPKEPNNPSKNQDVSHKKPLADGGSNDVENIEPKPHKEHMDEHKQNGDFKRWGQRRNEKKTSEHD